VVAWLLYAGSLYFLWSGSNVRLIFEGVYMVVLCKLAAGACTKGLCPCCPQRWLVPSPHPSKWTWTIKFGDLFVATTETCVTFISTSAQVKMSVVCPGVAKFCVQWRQLSFPFPIIQQIWWCKRYFVVLNSCTCISSPTTYITLSICGNRTTYGAPP